MFIRGHCRPLTLSGVLKLKAEYPDARLVVGNTEVGIEMKFKDARYPVLVAVTHVPELNHIEVRHTRALSAYSQACTCPVFMAVPGATTKNVYTGCGPWFALIRCRPGCLALLQPGGASALSKLQLLPLTGQGEKVVLYRLAGYRSVYTTFSWSTGRQYCPSLLWAAIVSSCSYSRSDAAVAQFNILCFMFCWTQTAVLLSFAASLSHCIAQLTDHLSTVCVQARAAPISMCMCPYVQRDRGFETLS